MLSGCRRSLHGHTCAEGGMPTSSGDVSVRTSHAALHGRLLSPPPVPSVREGDENRGVPCWAPAGILSLGGLKSVLT